MKRMMATEVQDPLVPANHLTAITLSLHKPEVVVDTLPRDPTQPIEHPDMTSNNDSKVMSKLKCAVCAPEYGNDAINA
jgi:hypothetical protein